MHKTANLTLAFGEYQAVINLLLIKRGMTAQALLEKLHVPCHVLARVRRGLVFLPDAEIYPSIKDQGEELIAAEVRWPRMARRLKNQRKKRIRS
jgi:hypothetical protein